MQLVFDRGTLLLRGTLTDTAGLPGILWDRRVGAWRAPACHHRELARELARRYPDFPDRVRPELQHAPLITCPTLRPYQAAAVAAWERAGGRGIIVLPTGAGKTRAAIAAMARSRLRTLCLDYAWLGALTADFARLDGRRAIEIFGAARAVIRQVCLRRLLCTVRRAEPERLDVSGPFSLFHHTTMYGHALASILPLLPRCTRFDLEAHCMVRGRAVTLRLGPGDPIAWGEPSRVYDSRLEERFARDFARANLDWDLVREPEPVETGEFLTFPDFAVFHRHDTARRFLLEIVGFRTPDYLREKLARMRAIPHVPLVLCIDRGLNCSPGELPPHARVVWFQKRIDPTAVLAAIEGTSAESVTSLERIGLGNLFVDWAGRLPTSDPVHRRLSRCKAGEKVRLRRHGFGIAIEAEDGPIAMLSRRACGGWLARLGQVISVTLVELLGRHATQSAPQWRSSLRCDRWTVPVVDVRFAASTEEPPAPENGIGPR